MEEVKLKAGWLKEAMEEAKEWKDSYSWYQVIEILDLLSMEIESKNLLNKLEEVRQKAVKKYESALYQEGVIMSQIERSNSN